jgi:hypothetical protein
MLIDPQQLDAAIPVMAPLEAGASPGLFSWVWKRVQQAICRLHGHDALLQFDRNRMFLRCASCGYETPGWEVNQHEPRLRFHGEGHRSTVARRPRLIAAVAGTRRAMRALPDEDRPDLRLTLGKSA